MTEIDSRYELISALHKAAALEHGVVCRYLFAGFSLKTHPAEGGATPAQLERVRTWQTTLFRVAREEMEHMGLVCNLLTAVGGAGHVQRPDWRRYDESAGAGTDLRRFDEATVAEFAALERAHTAMATVADDRREAGTDESIGVLYARIREGFDQLSRHNSLLFVGPEDAQVSNDTLNLPPGWYDFNLHRVNDLSTAVEAIDQIVEASQDSTRPVGASHADAFEDVVSELRAMRKADPDFEPARPVAPNPTVRVPVADERRGSAIRHPLTRRAAALFNSSYEAMLLMLGRFYAPAGEGPGERAALQKSLFFPLMTTVIRPLGEMLTRMPLDDGRSEMTAGPGFEVRSDLVLPPHSLSAWTVLQERLRLLAESAESLSRDVHAIDEPWARHVDGRMAFLHENLARLALNFELNVGLRPAQVHHLFKKVF